MFDYLAPRNGPVIDGFEDLEITYAKHQPQYIPLRTLVSANKEGAVWSRWTLTPDQRLAILKGADIFLEIATFGQPLQPIRMAVSEGWLNPAEVIEKMGVRIPPPRVQEASPEEIRAKEEAAKYSPPPDDGAKKAAG
jgi:hypothetical protein